MPFSYICLYVVATFVFGSAVGAGLGCIVVGFRRMAGHTDWKPFRALYFVGLDVFAIIALWMVPAMA